MNLSEGFRESWDTISHNKLRTFLTMLGMNIGVAAVIAIMASGLMARSAIMSGVESIGATLVWITPNYDIYENYEDRKYLVPEDLDAMKELVDDVIFSPVLRGRESLSYRGLEDYNAIYGVYPEYQKLWEYKLKSGRFINNRDIEERRKVVVLGVNTAKAFFAHEENPLGKNIRVGAFSFTVVGVMARRAQSFIGDGSNDETVYAPYSTLQNMRNWDYFGGPRMLQLNIQVNDIKNLDFTVTILERYLLARYGLYEGEPRFIVHKAEENIETFNKIFGIITTVISLIAGISLLVSGIGIMNIMLVTVTERTKEIGIRKAVGAKRADILIQFLIEAVIICLIGGGVGILIGMGIALAVASLQKWQYVMPVFALGLGIGVSACIGLFFGIYPAMKASRLDPVIALTKE